MHNRGLKPTDMTIVAGIKLQAQAASAYSA